MSDVKPHEGQYTAEVVRSRWIPKARPAVRVPPRSGQQARWTEKGWPVIRMTSTARTKRRRFCRSIWSSVTGSLRASSSKSSAVVVASSSARRSGSGGGAEPSPPNQALKYSPVPPQRIAVRFRPSMSWIATVAEWTKRAASKDSFRPTTSIRWWATSARSAAEGLAVPMSNPR